MAQGTENERAVSRRNTVVGGANHGWQCPIPFPGILSMARLSTPQGVGGLSRSAKVSKEGDLRRLEDMGSLG